jgi:hypothetical protein
MASLLDWLHGADALVPLHYGALHTYEKWLVPLVGIGPFVVMFVVVHFVRKRDHDADAEGEPGAGG